MAVYKLIQDIEAEDKLLGPLSLKAFIYALTAGFLAFLNFKIVTISGLGNFRWVLLLIFALPMLLFAVLASPLGGEQPTEVWLLSRVRFMVKPRKRVWDQTGLSHLVTITAPKKIERHLTKDLSQLEVQGRLQVLAMTMDSRGWAIKNVNLNAAPAGIQQAEANSDRLVSATSVPQAAPIVDVRPDDDIMDEQNSPTAKKFLGLMRQKDAEHKQDLASIISGSKNGSAASAKPAVTAESRADKLELAQSGNDLSVASIQKLASRQATAKRKDSNEGPLPLR
jgi:hypothetical protein